MNGPFLHAWSRNLGYAKRLVADIPEEHMAVQPAPGMNHAAWVLGHVQSILQTFTVSSPTPATVWEFTPDMCVVRNKP